MTYYKVLLSLFILSVGQGILGSSVQGLSHEDFVARLAQKNPTEVEQSIRPSLGELGIGNENGYFTTGLSPCYCFIFFDKETGETVFLSHYPPIGSEESVEDAKLNIASHLDFVLVNIEQGYFSSDSEDEDDEQQPLYDSISIIVIGGQKAFSGNSMKALELLAKEQYFPLEEMYFDLAGPKEILDVFSANRQNTFYQLCSLDLVRKKVIYKTPSAIAVSGANRAVDKKDDASHFQ